MEAARAAAQWWADQMIGGPVFRQVRPDQMDAKAVQTAGLAAAALDAMPKITKKQAATFVDLLAEAIEMAVAAHGSLRLSVDYGPHPILSDSAEAAGIDRPRFRFPIKTRMSVRPAHVIAALGYAAPWRLVWASPEWLRPTCNMHRRLGAYGDPLDELCGLPAYHEGECGSWRPDEKRCPRCGFGYAAHFSEHGDAADCTGWDWS